MLLSPWTLWCGDSSEPSLDTCPGDQGQDPRGGGRGAGQATPAVGTAGVEWGVMGKPGGEAVMRDLGRRTALEKCLLFCHAVAETSPHSPPSTLMLTVIVLPTNVKEVFLSPFYFLSSLRGSPLLLLSPTSYLLSMNFM